MNEVIAALPLVGSVVWTLRPRPPARRLAPVPSSDSTPTSSITQGAPVTRTERLRRRRRRARPVDPIALAHWCESVARCVRGGDALRSALERAPDDESVAPLIGAVRRHIADPHRPAPLPPDVALVAAVVAACLDQGGPAAEPLDRAAGVLRSRAAERDERRVQSAQARLSAAVLTWLPVAVLASLVVMSGAVRDVVASPLGLAFVIVGSLLNMAGWWWMRRIVERAAR